MTTAVFSIVPVKDDKPVEWVAITVNPDQIVERVATDADRKRFRHEYAAFKQPPEQDQPEPEEAPVEKPGFFNALGKLIK